MRLISLNTWMGIVREPLMGFVCAHTTTDVFCFQEVLNGGEEEAAAVFHDAENVKDHQLLQHLREALPDHQSFFYPHIGNWAGLAMFVRNGIDVLEEGNVFVYGTRTLDTMARETKYSPRNLQFARILIHGRPVMIANFHGLWSGGGKGDIPERIGQSERIVEFLHGIGHDVLICGDFNLEPQTKSMALLEESGLRNLITEYRIASTRTSLYTKPVKFADYVLVSRGIRVNNFRVLPDEVSDHAALYLEFE